jgi:hypothetical protein
MPIPQTDSDFSDDNQLMWAHCSILLDGNLRTKWGFAWLKSSSRKVHLSCASPPNDTYLPTLSPSHSDYGTTQLKWWKALNGVVQSE